MVKVAVVGTGMMAKGIAACCAAGGENEVVMYGRSDASLEQGLVKAKELKQFLQDNGVAKAVSGDIRGTTSLEECVRDAAFVFESIIEDLQAKRDLFRQLGDLCGPQQRLCTNTSSLSIAAIFDGMVMPERFAAAHFIGPAHLVPLVEVCPAPGTSSETISEVTTFLKSIGKKPVLLKKEIQGFIAARLQAALYREAMHLVQEGCADPEAVDGAVVNGFGRRLNQIGPFTQGDFAGVDLIQNTHATFFPQLGAYQRDIRADELVAQGRTGVKSGAGSYEWPEERVREVSGRRDAELLRRLKQDLE
eukprot:TRINITY_DN63260_c0_g1_i1.p1 TRINITY_DN63260_c0_g1~~TRINITY_DN63260_c0_g1_i1.p1  ORF type:complete len:305 (-),score=84.48 TRINITY_DN63260_c0_g1_i1:103-1017(-)